MEQNEERPDPGPEETRGPGEPAEPEPAGEPGEAQAAEAAPEAEAPLPPVGPPEPAGEPGETQAAEAAPEAEAPLPPVAERRRWELRRYVLTAAIAAGVVLFALGLFVAGFWTHSLLDEDADLTPIEDKLAALDARTNEIQETLRGAGGDTGGGTSPSAATSAAADDDPSWGPEDASVVIVEFSDFQCPFCKRFFEQTLPKIRDAYGDQVRFIYRDFPLTGIHQFAQKAAEAGQCAHEQGRFWDYHDLLFANQAALTVPDLKQYAEQVGMDSDEFNDCLDSDKNAREVALDFQDGRQAGIQGTPGFVIDGVLIPGAQPFEQFQAVIDKALASAE